MPKGQFYALAIFGMGNDYDFLISFPFENIPVNSYNPTFCP